jgi:hypothetical protein
MIKCKHKFISLSISSFWSLHLNVLLFEKCLLLEVVGVSVFTIVAYAIFRVKVSLKRNNLDKNID